MQFILRIFLQMIISYRILLPLNTSEVGIQTSLQIISLLFYCLLINKVYSFSIKLLTLISSNIMNNIVNVINRIIIKQLIEIIFPQGV